MGTMTWKSTLLTTLAVALTLPACKDNGTGPTPEPDPILLYDEAVGGDLAGDQNTPTPIGTLQIGRNMVVGTHYAAFAQDPETEPTQGDTYSASVPSGLEIVGIEVTVSNLRNFAGSTSTYGRVFKTPPFGGIPNGDSPLMSTAQTARWDAIVPLAGGRDYGFSLHYRVVQPGTSPIYDWSWAIRVRAAGG